MTAAPPPVTNPTAVAFWDARRGLLGGGSCATYACDRGAIALTTDGGRTFRVVLRTAGPVRRLGTAGPAGAIAVLAGGGLLRTLDGGRSWHAFRPAHDGSYATAGLGLAARPYVAGRRPALALYTTADGGATWRRRRSPCPPTLRQSALVDRVTRDLGWVVCLGGAGAGNQGKAVFRTRDGGRTWHRAAGAIPGFGYPLGLAVAPDGFGLLWEDRGTLYVTRDGGSHWSGEPELAAPELDFGRGGSALAGGVGFVLVGRGGGLPARLLATRDDGRTWRVVRRWPG